MTTGLLAFLSGVPALVYQVVWTRQVGLLAGGQIEAISIVLVAFFGGLALGAHFLGSVSDRSTSPLRVYGLLEAGAGVFAVASTWALRRLAEHPELSDFQILGISALVLVPTTFLLGGTLPALLRSVATHADTASGHAGILIGANTVGAVSGVAFAIAMIPTLGLRWTLLIASLCAISIGLATLALGRGRMVSVAKNIDAPSVRAGVLAAAFVVGAATLGFEVIAARMATIRLGSSLYAWGLVLSLFLVGLAMGNLAVARRARNSHCPERDLGWMEIGAACSVALGLALLRPDIAAPTAALGRETLAHVALAVLPATFFMGGAFPLLVRLAVRGPQIATTFGRVSAVNTLGGIGGALLVPFVLLSALGGLTAGLFFAAANAVVGLLFLVSRGTTTQRVRVGALATCGLVVASLPVLRADAPRDDPWVLFVAEGRQATAVVISSWGDRTLIVDGDPEASTTGFARRTEELLAVLPLVLHPKPERFLEVGLGSGVTLGTATRFPLDRIDCVEIAEAVIRTAPFFRPDNRHVTENESVTIVHSDARRMLSMANESYDVVVANTLHPWSVGATGLYSREYFARIAGALRPGGIAVQWLPTQQIDDLTFSTILRTFFDVFPEGGLWWGAGNIIAVGAVDPLPRFDPKRADARLAAADFPWQRLGWSRAEDLPDHFIADATAVRVALGGGDVLVDDRPLLERHAARGRVAQRTPDLYRTLVSIARQNVGNGAMFFWLESLELRARGNESGADAREALAAELGLGVARAERAAHLVAAGHLAAQRGDFYAATEKFAAALAIDPDERFALFGRAGIELQRGDIDGAISDLARIVAAWPDDVRAWNELAGAYARSGDTTAAEHAVDQALMANPYDLRTLANAGLLAVRNGNEARANAMLGRIRAVSPLGRSPQEKSLEDAIERSG
jgi:spermidine synthase